MIIHVVEQGQTITSIANEYNVLPERIIIDNELPNPDNLVVGQSIVIQFPEVIHTVVEGDTLFQLAQTYEVTPTQILQNNPRIAEQEFLQPGDTIVISYRDREPIDTVIINGYAYPFINRDVLRKTLPYLTYLSLFTYGFTPEGELVGIDDDELIEIALEFGVAPIMMLAPMSEQETFSSQLASDMFRNPEAQSRLIDNILANIQAKNYYGLDIDFEYVFPDDRELFVQFIQNVRDRLEPEGYIVMVALAPKTYAEQPGLLYEAHDYPAIGAIADEVLLMTYEWGYMFGPPMATAPLASVRRVLEYGITEIDPDKILMGIPNYAYDWPLPFVRGETAANAPGNQEVIELAAQYNVIIEFDEVAQAPYFFYTDEAGTVREVWFDDARSMDAKFRLIPEYGLSGAGYWQIMKFFPASWMVVNNLFNVEKVVE